MLQNCPICFEEIKILMTLGCSHVFCVKCFCSWYANNSNNSGCAKCKQKELGFVCPTCKETVTKLMVFNNRFDGLESLYFVEFYNLLKRLPYLPDKEAIFHSILLGKHIFNGIVPTNHLIFDNENRLHEFAYFCKSFYHFLTICLDIKH